MKKVVLLLLLLGTTLLMACGSREEAAVKEYNAKENGAQTDSVETTISGEFTVYVRDVIPDYCFDSVTPTVAVVTEFQSYPFTLFVGEEIGKELKSGEAYVFSIEPVVVEQSKEEVEKMSLSSLVWEVPEFKVTDYRLAGENEIGLESLALSLE